MSQTKAQLLDGKSATIQYTAGSASSPAISFTGDTNTGIYSPGTDQVAISTNGTGRLFVDASGNVCLKKEPANPNYSKAFTVVATDAAIALRANSTGTYTDQGIFFAVDGVNYSQIYNDSIGELIFRTGSGLSERLRITSAGLVGVGTSSPSYKLDVRGGNAAVINTGTDAYLYLGEGLGTQEYVQFGWISSSNVGEILTTGTGALSLATNSTSRLYITNTGNVGIGTTSPSSLLTVAGKATLTGAEDNQLEWSNGSQIWRANSVSGGNWYLYDATNAKFPLLVKPNSSSSIDIASTYLAFGTGGTERFRCDSSGRLLVGTSSARSGFQISTGFGNVTPVHQFEFNSQTYNGLSITHNAGANTYPAVLAFGKSRGSSAGSYTAVASGDGLGWLDFYGADGTNMVRAATISAEVDGTPGTNDMPGRLVFSITADGTSSPTERMRIRNNGSSNFFAANDSVAAHTSASAGTSFVNFAGYHSATTTTDGTLNFLVYSNGNVVNTNNSYGSLSDVKLKENIVDAGSQWNDLKALQVRNYNFKEATGQPTHTQIGLVAQEVELVSPGLVTESPDRDAEGNDLGTVTKSVNYSVLYMKAVKALQEAMERIEQLETEMAAVKAQLS